MSTRIAPSPGKRLAPTRLTREQSKAQTRARLIEVGRRHILEEGLGNVVAERIAEDAGFSRGAFYSNFADKEDLFLTIVQQDHEQYFAIFHALLDRKQNTRALLKDMRETIAKRIIDPQWIALQAELEAAALHSARIKKIYIHLHRQIMREGREVLAALSASPEVHFTLKPNETILTLLALSHGLAVNQHLLGAELPYSGTRKLIGTIFDQLIYAKEPLHV